jgi:hypothetical protein
LCWTAHAARAAEEAMITLYVSRQKDDPPLIRIFENGQTQFRDSKGKMQNTTLDKGTVAGLVEKLTRLDFLAIDQDDLDAQIKAAQDKAGAINAFVDGGVTQLEFAKNGQANVIRLAYSGMLARQYPDIDPLQKLRAAEIEVLTILTWLQKS